MGKKNKLMNGKKHHLVVLCIIGSVKSQFLFNINLTYPIPGTDYPQSQHVCVLHSDIGFGFKFKCHSVPD